MITLLGITAIVLSIYVTGCFIHNELFIKQVCYAVFSVLLHYVCLGGILFWMDSFSILLCLLLCNICFIGYIFISILKKKRFQTSFSFPKSYWLLTLLVFSIPFFLKPFGLYGMGQDEGVYQIKAIELVNGNTDRILHFPEYEGLAVEEQEVYRTTLSWMLGLDNIAAHTEKYGEFPTYSGMTIADCDGVYHGIPTFPALLALSAAILGLPHMNAILLLFYYLALMFLFFLEEDFALNTPAKIFGLACSMCCPLLIWVTKSSLTEIVLVCCITLFLHALRSTNPTVRRLSFLPLLMYSFIHITFFILLPVIYLVYILAYRHSKEQSHLFSMICTTFGFYVSTLMSYFANTRYVFMNLQYSFGKLVPGLSPSTAIPLLFVFITVLLALSLCLSLRMPRPTVQKCGHKLLTAAIVTGTILFLTIEGIRVVQNLERFGSLRNTILHLYPITFLYVTGYLILPLIVVFFLFRFKKTFCDSQFVPVIMWFLYCVVFYGCFLRPYIQYFYYYARYIAPFIPIVILLGTICLNQVKPVLAYSILGASICLMLPAIKVVATEQDDTKLQYEQLEAMASYLSEDDAIIMDSHSSILAALPLRAMTNASYYPVFKDVSKELEDVSARIMGDVYYATLDSPEAPAQGTLIYSSTYEASEDDGNHYGYYNILPKEFTKTQHTIRLYKLTE